MKDLSVLALAGSLRKASSNRAMLEMAATHAPPGICIKVYPGLGDLPLFNPDLESTLPRPVIEFQEHIARADALLIASPEYAHGVSGVMKNALDWLVSSGVLVDKPVALWNASPRASHALAALRETLTVMSARLVDSAALELLILAQSTGGAPVNPNPKAMELALQALRWELAKVASDQS